MGGGLSYGISLEAKELSIGLNTHGLGLRVKRVKRFGVQGLGRRAYGKELTLRLHFVQGGDFTGRTTFATLTPDILAS